MKKLFLSSSFAEVKNLFQDFIKNDLKDKRVLFIPTASLFEEINFYIDDAKAAFKSLGMKIEILELTEVTEEIAKEKISSAEFLYISGGNTFFLLQELKKKDLCSLISKRVDDGIIYIGESAGSIVAAADIEYVEGMDDKSISKDLNSTKAMNLINFYPLVHYGEFPFAEVSYEIERKYKDKLNLLKINNKQAITIEDDKTRIVE